MIYNRERAVEYAKKWALGRNTEYFDYTDIGGDCTNFISQCLYAGKPQMNYEYLYGWYYINANDKSPSWTGVEFLYKFLINNDSVGPRGRVIEREELELGDVIQLSFNGVVYGHSLIITEITDNEIYICAHSIDSLNRALSSYNYIDIRYIKIS